MLLRVFVDDLMVCENKEQGRITQRSVYKPNGRAEQGNKKTVESSLSNDDSTAITATFEDRHGADSEAIKNMLSDVISQFAKEKEGYMAEQKIQEQILFIHSTKRTNGMRRKCHSWRLNIENKFSSGSC
ncbi:PREDICTED: uncharacterized protein LOC104707374 isoform X1 [Camelina sativa]|uniref:Uncharacterized protein LOC104707374 isoform X1 n=1 Tax=Camelina sativa TaxID=90675 RepID=A0ABM1QBC3_CAMSA|nr:PREDICTED: uncharacterized protein LOC104707374 isoform X1 [Camelina sativa]